MMMKRKSSSNREAMDFMEFSREATRLLRDAQCLQRGKTGHVTSSPRRAQIISVEFWLIRGGSPRHFEDPQETYAAEDRDTKRGHDGELHQDGLHDAAAHHETVKAIKQGHKVGLQPQAVHLHEHLQGEHCQENFVGNLCGEAEQQNFSNVGDPGGPGYEFYELADQSGTDPELRSASLVGCSARRQW